MEARAESKSGAHYAHGACGQRNFVIHTMAA